MTIVYSGTSNGQSFSMQANYNVGYASSSTIKAYLISTDQAGSGPSSTQQLTAWVLFNGTILAAYVQAGGNSGQNLTGAAAQQAAAGLFEPFVIEVGLGHSLSNLTSSAFSSNTGTSQVNIGPTHMTVTNYATSGTATLTTGCGTDNLQSFSMSVGQPPGTTFNLITYLSESGSFTSDGNTSDGSVQLQVTSLSVAA